MANMVSAGRSMKELIALPNMVDKAKNLLQEGGASFLSSVLDLYNSDTLLSKCNPVDVLAECWKAAALKLPVQKGIGKAYIIPYGGKPQFQLGYRGLIELALRTGQYKWMNAGVVREGQKVKTDILSGMVEITGEDDTGKVKGYFAYFKLVNGFEKSAYWTREKVEAHAKRFSKAWSKQDSPWHTDFDAMALKTVIKDLISKWGMLSVEMAGVMSADTSVEEKVENEVAGNSNGEELTVDGSFVEADPADTAKAPEDATTEAAKPVDYETVPF